LFSGRTFAAQEAYELGLVSKIVPDAGLDTAANVLAADFAAKSPLVMRLARSAFMRQNDDRRRIADAVEDFCNVVTGALFAQPTAGIERKLDGISGWNRARLERHHDSVRVDSFLVCRNINA
jgi:enoyl-CoA hydratase/carnithine racemase